MDLPALPIAARPATILYHPPEACSQTQQIGLALRIAVPLIGNVIEGNCQINSDRTAGSFYAMGGVVLQALSWALATLAVAGFTNLIRQT